MKIQRINGEDVFANTSVAYTVNPTALSGEDMGRVMEILDGFRTDPDDLWSFPRFSRDSEFTVYIEYAITDDSESGEAYLVDSEHGPESRIRDQRHYPDPETLDAFIDFCEERKDGPAVTVERKADINLDHSFWEGCVDSLDRGFPEEYVSLIRVRYVFAEYFKEADFMASQGRIRGVFDDLNRDFASYHKWVRAFID